jgi:hypothetical protein
MISMQTAICTNPPEISEILIEIRDLKASLVKSADRLGRLEKKLRTKLKES